MLVGAGVCCVIVEYIVEWGQSRGDWYGTAGALEYFQSSVLGGIGLSMPLMMSSERDLLTALSVSPSLDLFRLNNCSKRHSFPLLLFS